MLCLAGLIYNEFLVYYIVLYKCNYPRLALKDNETVVNAMVLADTHLLGSRNGHWFDKLRREWQMHRAFQTSITYFRPEAVFFLGDVFDEGKWCPPAEFEAYMKRFEAMFGVGDDTQVFVVAGNHDIGFHYAVTPYLDRRFREAFGTDSVRKVSLKGVDFILINSMAFHGDGCSFCSQAKKLLKKVASDNGSDCPECGGPVLLSHFPLFRESDAHCNEPDAAPESEKSDKFREQWECISKASSSLLKQTLKPRVAFTGHTHHGCRTEHHSFTEWTVSSFSWRNKKNPAFLLARFSGSGGVSVSKCEMPDENTVYYVYMAACALCVLYTVKIRNRTHN